MNDEHERRKAERQAWHDAPPEVRAVLIAKACKRRAGRPMTLRRLTQILAARNTRSTTTTKG